MELSVDSKEHDLSDEGIKWRNVKPKTRVWSKYCFNGDLHECQEGKWPFAPLLRLHESIVAKEPVVQNC